MKASELLKEIQQSIDLVGDTEVEVIVDLGKDKAGTFRCNYHNQISATIGFINKKGTSNISGSVFVIRCNSLTQ